MSVLSKTQTAKMLRQLATFVARRQRTIERNHLRQSGYDQRRYRHGCGTPACLWGHAADLFSDARVRHQFEAALEARLPVDPARGNAQYHTLWAELCYGDGCDNAREDWRKAVAYVRRVAKLMQKRGVASLLRRE